MAELDDRKQAILDAVRTELERQSGAREGSGDRAFIGGGPLDLVAIAVAVDAALGGDGKMPDEEIDDGRTPDELNAANDV